MDWYCYFMERFTWGSNPYPAVSGCRQVVDEMISNPAIPFRISTEAAVGFLSAIRDFAGDGCFVSAEYDTVLASLVGELHTMQEAVTAADSSWSQEMENAGQGENGGPPYDPGDFTVWPVDEDGEEPEEMAEPVEIPTPPEDLEAFNAIQRLYGDGGESGTTGARRPFPDWEHADEWTQTDWEKLQIYKNKVLAPIEHSFDYMRPATDTLAAIEFHIHRLPLPGGRNCSYWLRKLWMR